MSTAYGYEVSDGSRGLKTTRKEPLKGARANPKCKIHNNFHRKTFQFD